LQGKCRASLSSGVGLLDCITDGGAKQLKLAVVATCYGEGGMGEALREARGHGKGEALHTHRYRRVALT
jgi:hypothetical protein